MTASSGFLLLDKPRGTTSFKALAPLKKWLSTGRVGHAGTLDSFATGLLVVLAGYCTRLGPWFTGCDKSYRAVAQFGLETDTLDPEGTVVARSPVPTRDALEAVLPAFTGFIRQKPPAYSAVHIAGRRAHELVRAGFQPEMRERQVEIASLVLEAYDGGQATFRIACSAGTYIRSLARDIACACGSRASLASLRRLTVGPFDVSEAHAPDERITRENLRAFDPETAFMLGLEPILVPPALARAVTNGVPLEAADLAGAASFVPDRLLPIPRCSDFESGERHGADLPGLAFFSEDRRFLGIGSNVHGCVVYRMVAGDIP